MGWFSRITSPVRKVAKSIVGGVERISDDFLGIDDSGGIVGSVSKIGENFEDALRSAVEELDNAIQDPRVRLLANFIVPGSGVYLDAYATLDSGEELSPTQIAAIAAQAGQDFESLNITPEQTKAINTAAAAIEGDPLKVLVSAYGEDWLEQSGLKQQAEQAISSQIGQDAYNLIQDNMDIARVGYDIAIEGKDPLEAISNRYGDEIVNLLGTDDPNARALGYAGLATAVQLDKGVDADEAIYKGAKEYYDRGGRIEDLQLVGSVADLGDIDFNLDDFLSQYNIDFGQLGDQYSISDLFNLGIDLNKLNIPTPDLLSQIDLGQAPDLNLDLGKFDWKGLKRTDLGDYNLRQLKDMGVNVNDLDLDLEFKLVALNELLKGEPMALPIEEEEQFATLTSEFDQPQEDEALFSREVLGRTFNA